MVVQLPCRSALSYQVKSLLQLRANASAPFIRRKYPAGRALHCQTNIEFEKENGGLTSLLLSVLWL
eukprot:424888-Amphidinium_carterae.1